MAGNWIGGFLAAFGLLSIVWAIFGWLLPGSAGCVVVYTGNAAPDGTIRRISWLRGLGFLRCPLVIPDAKLSIGEREALRRRRPWVKFCHLEDLVFRLEQERCKLG